MTSQRALQEGTGALLASLRQQSAAQQQSEVTITVQAPSPKRAKCDEGEEDIPADAPLPVVEPTVDSSASAAEPSEEVRPFPSYSPKECKLVHTVDAFNSTKCRNNYLKCVKWSSNGGRIAVAAQDRRLRLFDYGDEVGTVIHSSPLFLQTFTATHTIVHGDLIYDTCWMNKQDTVATSSRCSPIHLWSPSTGKTIASYRGINHLDELSAAFCVCFTPDDRMLIGGYKKHIRLFDVSRPGRHMTEIDCTSKTGVSHAGIVSCVAASPHTHNLFVAGSYNGSIGLYNSDTKSIAGGVQQVHDAHDGGVTHIMFAPNDPFRIYSGGRMDPFIHVWDSRMPGAAVASLARDVNTNQRVYFDISPCGNHIASGGSKGELFYWHVPSDVDRRKVDDFDAIQPTVISTDAKCAIACTSFNPSTALLATGSGQRTFPIKYPVLFSDDSSSDDEGEKEYVRQEHHFDNALRLYRL